jgi:hypothetical protein
MAARGEQSESIWLCVKPGDDRALECMAAGLPTNWRPATPAVRPRASAPRGLCPPLKRQNSRTVRLGGKDTSFHGR